MASGQSCTKAAVGLATAVAHSLSRFIRHELPGLISELGSVKRDADQNVYEGCLCGATEHKFWHRPRVDERFSFSLSCSIDPPVLEVGGHGVTACGRLP